MERNQRLKILRILNGFTQEELAKECGVPRGSLSIWERGDHAPSHGAVPRLANSLGCDPGYLMYGSPSLRVPAVWVPSVPLARHLPTFKNDITSLFPPFLKENGIDVVEYLYRNGGVLFLLGEKQLETYNFMLISDSATAEHFLQSLSSIPDVSEIQIKERLSNFAKQPISDTTPEDIGTILKYSRFREDDSGLCMAYAKLLDHKSKSVVPNDSTLKLAFMTFCQILNGYEVSHSQWDAVYSVFANLYEEIQKASPDTNIMINTTSDIMGQLEKIGCSKIEQHGLSLVFPVGSLSFQTVNKISNLSKDIFEKYFRNKTVVGGEAYEQIQEIIKNINGLMMISASKIPTRLHDIYKILGGLQKDCSIEGSMLITIIGALFELSYLSSSYSVTPPMRIK
jgi:transcriptional regulator with XRE-family HTH domain